MSKLNNIDDAIRNSFEDFEMPFDASQWNMLENKLDNNGGNDLTSFDKKIKETVSGHEVAYNPAAWTAIESQLTSTYSYTKWFLAAGIIGLVSLGVYFLTDTENNSASENGKNENKELAENNSVGTDTEIEEKETVESSNLTNLIEKSESFNSETNSEKVTNEKEIIKSEDQFNNVDEILMEPFLGDNKKTNQNSTPELTIKKWNISSPTIIGKTEICESEELKLSSSEISDKVNVQWLLNGIKISDQKEIVLKNLNEGTHEIELIHTAKDEFKSNCIQPSIKKTISVIVNENVMADFKFEQSGDAFYPETKFNVLSVEKNVKYTWIVDNQTFTGEEITYLFNKKGNHEVSLLAENTNGCRFIERKNIEISTDYNLLAPIAFTPNYDGLNDEFIPEALKYLNLPFKLVIYDRQQGIMYQTTRSDAPWDGRNMNTGDSGGQGAYLWMVELTNKNGEIEQYSGTITILK